MAARSEPRVILIHDWLTGMRGGEKCLEVLCQRWPEAPLYTLLHHPGSVSPAIEQRPLHTSWLNQLPAVHRYYRYLLPAMPVATAMWHLPPCDLVVSFSHCVAKSVRPPRGVPHVCYCFTPMRYAWHMQESYFDNEHYRGPKAWLVRPLLRGLRAWDRATAHAVTHFIAISRTVQQRIRDCYDRDSVVIYPPVDTDFYHPVQRAREEYFLVVSAFAPYKRVDLAIEACRQFGKKLVIIGTGQDEARLRRMAGPHVTFLGWQPDEVIRGHLQRCQALLFPGEEDFGIVPVEAMACGTPVIAYGKGGATETVICPASGREPTGLWFEEQSAECLAEALRTFERQRTEFSPLAARRQAQRFQQRRFREELLAYLAGITMPATPSLRQAA